MFKECGLDQYLNYDEKLQQMLFQNLAPVIEKSRHNNQGILTKIEKTSDNNDNHLIPEEEVKMLQKKREREINNEKRIMSKLTKEEYQILQNRMKNRPITQIIFNSAPQVIQFNFS